MDFSEVIRSTGTVRSFRDVPVPDDVVYDILNDARFAGSGGNRQGWRVIVVKDDEIRLALRDLYVDVFAEYVDSYSRGLVPYSPEWTPPVAPPARQPFGFADELHQVPVLLLILAEMSTLAITDSQLDRPSVVGGASIYPFVQNILLAARNRDLGAALTTLLSRTEPAVAQLCGIPETHALAAMVALGYQERPIKRLNRRPVPAFTTLDTFSGDVFTTERGNQGSTS